MPELGRMAAAGPVPSGRRASLALAVLVAAAVALVAASAASADDVSDFQGSWVSRALASQYELGSDVGFVNAPLLGTHNSFNSVAEMGPTLEPARANQDLDLTDQLEVGVRSLELDLHRSAGAGGPVDRPVVCHTTPFAGCTATRELDPLLAEIGDWLRRPESSEQVVLLYLEDDLDDLGTHDAAARIIDADLGDLIYRPSAGGCEEVPAKLTRDQVRAAGKQVVIVSGCGSGEAWQSLAFSWREHRESRPRGFEDFPACGPDFTPEQYRTSLIRYYEDVTRRPGAGGADDGITPRTAAAMARCGVDLLGFDRLEPLDGRLRSSVWSWAPREPARGRCAVIATGRRALREGRWVAKRCRGVRARPACRPGRRWLVGPTRVDVRGGRRYCRTRDAQLAVPRTGYENQLLRAAMDDRGTRTALLGYRVRHGEWAPLDVRGLR